MAERDYDIVLFGATGFTGALTAEYLAEHAPAGTRWAAAGRSPDKLAALTARLPTSASGSSDPGIIVADIGDPASVQAMAAATKVLITTVGPYSHYGQPVVAACAAAGTDYVDLTGEPGFVDKMWLIYNDQARETGARIVSSCGFDSLPFDLGTLFTVSHLPEGVPISVSCFVRVGGTFSGGTYHSAVQVMSSLRESADLHKQRRAREPQPEGRRVHGVLGYPHHDHDAGGWVVPFPSIDAQHVLNSACALDRYGPDFSYSHYIVAGNLPMTVGMLTGAGVATALAQLPPTRKLLLKLKDPGEGPSPEQREKAWFKARLVGEGGGRRVVAEVSGGDPGYTETSKMLAESALCLVHDDLPPRAGVLTPAVAMGHPLIDRLQAAGIRFEVIG
jgi:short subunit dehydrogenase-like uncharacterized protein